MPVNVYLSIRLTDSRIVWSVVWWNGISPQVIRTLTLAYRSIVAYVPKFSPEKLSMREVSGSDVKVIH